IRRDPSAPPRPHRRAYEMDRAHAVALEFALERQVEVGRVDTDEHRNAFREKPARKRAPYSENFRQAADDLGKPADGERFERMPRLAAGRLHFRSGDADEARFRNAGADGFDQHRRERVARSLSGDDTDGEVGGSGDVSHVHPSPLDQRTMPSVDATARKSTSGRSTGAAVAAAARAAFASSSASPSR